MTKKEGVPREDKKGKLGMREEGMLWTAGEISPLDKIEILDKAKNNEKIPLDKAESFGIKKIMKKYPLTKLKVLV